MTPGSGPSLRQAIVFCGGMGTRLRPLTNSTPKPMVDVGGRPFLEHLLDQLANQGIDRFVLATGYLGDQIHDHFGSGSPWGWEVEYSVGPPEWKTGRRFREAVDLLDDRFLLLYSDNFAPFDLESLVRCHLAGGRPLTVTLKEKSGGNVGYSSDTNIVAYDPTRGTPGLDYVEIGYAIVERDAVLDILGTIRGQPNISFSKVLGAAAEAGLLGGFPTEGAYYSISDPERLEMTAEYLAPKQILLLDRDGTINRKKAPGEYVETWEDFDFILETVRALRELSAEGFEFIVITNQAGIALGVLDEVEVGRIHENMKRELYEMGVEVLDVYVCPDHWDSGSSMRKPKPGMFHLASDQHCFRLDRVLYVGDDVRDCQAAAAAGCGMVYLAEEAPVAQLPVNHRHCSEHRFLTDAVEVIQNFYGVEDGS